MAEKMSGATAIVRCLEIEEVNHVFCVPGESYLPIIDGLFQHESIKLISARHESGAAFMAEGYAKSTKKCGIVFATRGVGACNLSIGVHTAYQDSTPMIIFLGQVHSKFLGREGFQEIDLVSFFAPITKWAVEINNVDRIPELVQRAFRVAKTGRPGPVVIALPEDVLISTSDMIFFPKTERPKPLADPDSINRFKEYVNTAKKPLVLVGGGIKLSNAEEELQSFINRVHLPVMTAFRRHDVFPNSDNHYSGHLGLGIQQSIIKSVKEADLIIAIGTRLSEVTTQDYSLFTEQQTLVHVDIDDRVIGKVFKTDLSIVADAKAFLKQVESIEMSGDSIWCERCRKRYIQSIAVTNDKEELNMEKVIRILQKQLPEQLIVTNDAGNFAGWLHRYFQFNTENNYVGPTSGAMGYGMPAALGAKLGNPQKTVVSLSGDGGFMMTIQELETAKREHVAILSLVFNNAMYGTIRMYQEKIYPNRTIGTTLSDLNYSEIAKVVGWTVYTVEHSIEFERILPIALKELENGPVLIELKQNPSPLSVNDRSS